MCLLFFNVNDSCSGDEFRLVLVNNRDEAWQRPTKCADFWNHNQSCIGGLDQEPGREGGTWFGASQQGRIACLVNISAEPDPTRKGRGFLVRDFLTKADTVESYATEVSSHKDGYNGFNLTLLELGEEGSQVVHVTNDSQASSAMLQSKPTVDGYYSIGNSRVKFPWRKVSEGQDRFAQIVDAHRKVSTKDHLKEELFQMMADKTRYWPDPHLQKQGQESGWEQDFIETMSALFVWSPTKQYGTRTTTVLLIDGQGNCEYTEKTLQTPVNIDNPQWSSVQFTYKLQPMKAQL